MSTDVERLEQITNRVKREAFRQYMTLNQLAQKANIMPHNRVFWFCRNKLPLNIIEFIAIADALGVSCGYLLGEESKEEG